MRRTIAVDFDGCICVNKWPKIGEPRQQVINELIRAQAEGARLILWTCREGAQLDAAVMWCLNHGLRFDAVNDNLQENIAAYGNNCRKVWADEYWDDRSVLVVNAGELTSIAFSKPEGGVSVMRWPIPGVQFVRHEGATCPIPIRKRGWREKLRLRCLSLREIMRLQEP